MITSKDNEKLKLIRRLARAQAPRARGAVRRRGRGPGRRRCGRGRAGGVRPARRRGRRAGAARRGQRARLRNPRHRRLRAGVRMPAPADSASTWTGSPIPRTSGRSSAARTPCSTPRWWSAPAAPTRSGPRRSGPAWVRSSPAHRAAAASTTWRRRSSALAAHGGAPPDDEPVGGSGARLRARGAADGAARGGAIGSGRSRFAAAPSRSTSPRRQRSRSGGYRRPPGSTSRGTELMLDRIESLRAEASAAIAAAPDAAALEELRVRHLGRKSELTGILRGIAELEPTSAGRWARRRTRPGRRSRPSSSAPRPARGG